MTNLYETIRTAVENASGIRIHADLATVNGGNHLLPPTYADAPLKHNMTPLDAEGVSSWVSVDSPASFANRVEAQLARSGLGIAPLGVSVAGRTLSTLDLPHRCFDAILRDSKQNGALFRDTEIGQAVLKATPGNAGGLLRYDPAVLLLGGWDSTALGRSGKVGNKWPAALSVEIHATEAVPVQRAGNRVDPLGMEGTEAVIVEHEDGTWRLVETEEDRALPALGPRTRDTYPRRIKPSEGNLGNALSLNPKGVLVRGRIELRGAISLSRLRRYRFGPSDEDNIAARTALALMGVFGVAAAIEDGLDLRRDCELVADSVDWALVRTGATESIHVEVEEAREALNGALENIEIAQPVTFTAGDNLEQLLARVQ